MYEILAGAFQTVAPDGEVTNIDTLADDGEYVVKGYVSPEDFGAVGDGVTDDTAAIEKALNASKTVLFPGGTYLMSKGVTGTAEEVIGLNATIVTDADIPDVNMFSLPNAVEVHGFNFDFREHGVSQIFYLTNAEEVHVSDITIRNIKDMRPKLGTQAILCIGNKNALVERVFAYNCKHIKNGTIGDFGGNCQIITVRDWKETSTVRDCYCEDIHNIDSTGAVAFEDSGLVYLIAEEGIANTSYISNCHGKNYGKRLIKCVSGSTTYIDHCSGYSKSQDMLCGIAVGNDTTAIIDKCKFVNEYPQDTSFERTSRQIGIANNGICVLNDCEVVTSWDYASITNSGSIVINGGRVVGNGFINGGGASPASFVANHLEFIGHNLIYSGQSAMVGVPVRFNYCSFTSDISTKAAIDLLNADYTFDHCAFCGCIRTTTNAASTVTLDDCVVDIHTKDPVNVFYINSKRFEARRTHVKVNLPSDAGKPNLFTVLDGVDFHCDEIYGGGDGLNFLIGAQSKPASKMTLGTGIDFGKCYIKEVPFTNVPQYVDALPNARTAGLMVILKTDGKLYKANGSSWTAVN